MIPEAFTRYVALGDSVSLDTYPALDAGATDVAVALERNVGAGRIAPLGAASLLYKNVEERWPEEAGNDLSSANPSIVFQNLAADDATIGDVFGEQMGQVEQGDDPVLFTLTIGANDLFSAYANRPKKGLLERIERDIAEAYDFLVDMIRGQFPNGVLIVNTLYDPSDRTRIVPGVTDELGPFPLEILDRLNDHIRALAIGTPRVLLADVYARFLGHGVSVDEKDQWYWRRSMVEVNAEGANQLRLLWLETLREAVGE